MTSISLGCRYPVKVPATISQAVLLLQPTPPLLVPSGSRCTCRCISAVLTCNRVTVFQAPQSLIERHGCIAGYPDGFRGDHALTRYEFAAGVYARLNSLAERTAGSVGAAELATLRRLQTARVRCRAGYPQGRLTL